MGGVTYGHFSFWGQAPRDSLRIEVSWKEIQYFQSLFITEVNMHWEHFGRTKSRFRFTCNLYLVREIRTMKSNYMGLVLAVCTLEVSLENCLLLLLLLLLVLVNNEKSQSLCLVAGTSHTNMQRTKHINYCLDIRSTSSWESPIRWFLCSSFDKLPGRRSFGWCSK